MREVAFLERLAENLLEGGFARALKARLQPVQIAKACTREMERGLVVGVDGPIVPNRYLAYLHPDDLAGFSVFQASLERELAGYVAGYAARRGYRLLGSPTVRLLQQETGARLGRVRVEASLADAPSEMGPASSLPSLPEGTMEMPVALAPARPAALTPPREERPAAMLVDEAGQCIELKAQTSLGRAVDNDLVLESRGVSRHHAQILWLEGRYLLVDMGSTNGSFAGGRKVARHVLADGEEISFGDVRFTFRLADPQP